jgi:hypothetical protein
MSTAITHYQWKCSRDAVTIAGEGLLQRPIPATTQEVLSSIQRTIQHFYPQHQCQAIIERTENIPGGRDGARHE